MAGRDQGVTNALARPDAGNVAEVPARDRVHATAGCAGNVQRVGVGFGRHCSALNQGFRQVHRGIGHRKPDHAIQRRNAPLGCLRVAVARLVQHQRGDEEVIAVPGQPQLLRVALAGGVDRIRARARRQIADD